PRSWRSSKGSSARRRSSRSVSSRRRTSPAHSTFSNDHAHCAEGDPLMTPTRLFEGKRVLVFGVANERSIAWGIARAMHEHGASFIFTYAGDALEKRVRPLAESVNAELTLRCDLTNDAEVESCFEQVRAQWDGIDVLIHAV